VKNPGLALNRGKKHTCWGLGGGVFKGKMVTGTPFSKEGTIPTKKTSGANHSLGKGGDPEGKEKGERRGGRKNPTGEKKGGGEQVTK